jgi:hypothetical protein
VAFSFTVECRLFENYMIKTAFHVVDLLWILPGQGGIIRVPAVDFQKVAEGWALIALSLQPSAFSLIPCSLLLISKSGGRMSPDSLQPDTLLPRRRVEWTVGNP